MHRNPESLIEMCMETISEIHREVENVLGSFVEAQEYLYILEEKLRSVGKISQQEKVLQTLHYDELLSLLWSRLGGNLVKRQRFDRNLALLRSIEKDRAVFLASIANVVIRLKNYLHELDYLRSATGRATIRGMKVETQLAMINKALARLSKANEDMHGKRRDFNEVVRV